MGYNIVQVEGVPSNRNPFPVIVDVSLTPGSGGTLTNPFRIDPTGTTTQPVLMKDGGNISCMDDVNHALRVNVVVGGGGGGGAVTIADGADVTQGAMANARSTATDATPVTIMQVDKQISFSIQSLDSKVIACDTGNVAITSSITLPVSVIGTVPVSIAGTVTVTGTVTTNTPKSSSSNAPTQTAVTVAALNIVAANASRKRLIIQNTGTAVVKLTFSATNPTDTAYHYALAPASSNDDGTGASVFDDCWTGVVNAKATTNPSTVVVTEFS